MRTHTRVRIIVLTANDGKYRMKERHSVLHGDSTCIFMTHFTLGSLKCNLFFNDHYTFCLLSVHYYLSLAPAFHLKMLV